VNRIRSLLTQLSIMTHAVYSSIWQVWSDVFPAAFVVAIVLFAAVTIIACSGLIVITLLYFSSPGGTVQLLAKHYSYYGSNALDIIMQVGFIVTFVPMLLYCVIVVPVVSLVKHWKKAGAELKARSNA